MILAHFKGPVATQFSCVIFISALMVEVFTDKALSLDNLLSYGPMHSAFEEFMKHEKSMGKAKYFFLDIRISIPNL